MGEDDIMGAGISGNVIIVTNEDDLPTFNSRGKSNTRYDYYLNNRLKKVCGQIRKEFLY